MFLMSPQTGQPDGVEGTGEVKKHYPDGPWLVLVGVGVALCLIKI